MSRLRPKPLSEAERRRLLEAIGDLADPSGTEVTFDAAAARLECALAVDPADAAATLAGFASSMPMTSTEAPETGLLTAVLDECTVYHADAPLQLVRAQLHDLATGVRRGGRRFADLDIGGGRRSLAVCGNAKDASAWPLTDDARVAAERNAMACVVLVFTPSLSPGFVAAIRRAFDLTPGEADLAAALFECETMEDVARQLRIGRATVRDRMRAVLRKTGSVRRAGLMARITELAAGDYPRATGRFHPVRQAFGLTSAEGRVAELIAEGLSVPQVAERNGVSAHTARAQLDASLGKTGQRNASGLARLLSELAILVAWTSAGETRRRSRRDLLNATRIVLAPGGRRIAVASFGPDTDEAVLCFHPGLAYRLPRKAFRDALAAQGMRVVSFDLPACGLTDAAPGVPFLEACARDAERVVETLRLRRVHVFASFGGVAPALAFAARQPQVIGRGLLLMPRPPGDTDSFAGTLKRLFRTVAFKPFLARALFEAIRRSSNERLVRWMHANSSVQTEADRRTATDAVYMDERVSEVLASMSRSVEGMLDLDAACRAWTLPRIVSGSWTAVETGAEVYPRKTPSFAPWAELPGFRALRLADAGRSALHTHAGVLAALLSGPPN